MLNNHSINTCFIYAIGAAVLYGLHHIFKKLTIGRIGDGLGECVLSASSLLPLRNNHSNKEIL